MRPLGLSHELRAVFRVDGMCWGAAGMVRRGDFSDREVEFISSVAPALATATRVVARSGNHRGHGEPAIIVVGPGGEPRFAAYGMTARERGICHEVIAVRSTSGIATRLAITTHTVQDHLKSVSGKPDVRSRGELVAKLRPEDYDERA